MGIRDLIVKRARKLKEKNRGAVVYGNIRDFAFPGDQDVFEDIKNKYHFTGDLLDLFASNEGPIVHKWHHYIPLYHRYFEKYRGTAVKFLEIGVSKGGSLQLWRNYLGHSAVIFGIDIRQKCLSLNGQCAQVRIGSQADGGFLDSVVSEMGGVDVVLDDGSHQMKHVRASLEKLFPHLSEGGIYMIEDLHTAYWTEFGGGYNHKNNFFKFVMELVNDMHHWYHQENVNNPAISLACAGIHIHDSIVVLEKSTVHKPAHSRIGNI